MFGTTGGSTIVYVDRNKLQFYGAGFPSVLALDIPTTLVQDLEIINPDGLNTLISQWVKQHPVGAQLCIVLSQLTYYEFTITQIGESQQETEILKFYDVVPFEEMMTKIVSLDGVKKAYAMNKTFVDAIRKAFPQGIRVVAVIPVGVLGKFSESRWMDAAMAVYVQKHIETIREYNIVDLREKESHVTAKPTESQQPKQNTRLMVMVGIFGVLLFVLIFLIFIRPS